MIYDLPEKQMKLTQRKILSDVSSDAKIALEIGCWLGESTELIAKNVKKNSGKLFVIDWFKGNEGTPLSDSSKEHNICDMFIKNMEEAGVMDVITIIRGDSKEVHTLIKDNFFDFIYIDADHRFSIVIQDLRNFYPKLMAGGLFCGHDMESDKFDEKYVEEDFVDCKHHGVIKAVGMMFGPVRVRADIWSRRKHA